MRATIVIVEDEAPLARNIKSYLDRAGYDVTVAETLKRGIELYGSLRPEVMLIDHNLPDGTGLELIRRIRRDDRDTKLVMTTAHGGVQVARIGCSVFTHRAPAGIDRRSPDHLVGC